MNGVTQMSLTVRMASGDGKYFINRSHWATILSNQPPPAPALSQIDRSSAAPVTRQGQRKLIDDYLKFDSVNLSNMSSMDGDTDSHCEWAE